MQTHTPHAHPEFTKLEDVESALRGLYVESSKDDCYLVRYLGTSGEPGARCLTLNLELRNDYFDSVRDFMESLVGRIRARGFTVDELLQKVAEEPVFDIRLWLLIYETETHDEAS